MQVIVEDLTPIVIGPYEDPNIADAFVNDAGALSSDASSRNAMLVSSTRNLAKIKFNVSISGVVSRMETTDLRSPVSAN